MSISNLSQARARFAYQAVFEAKDKEWSGEFKSFVKKTPMMIRNNGLAATYAFIWSKAEQNKAADKKTNRGKAWDKLGEVSQDWIKQKVFDTTGTFYEKMLTLSSQDYRRTTREILTLFTWLKRYADAIIEKEGSDES